MYKKVFFQNQKKGSGESAEEIVPIILKLVNPKSVVDVGCGTGVWLSVFRKNGIKNYLGIDGDWVTEEILEIPINRFTPKDLTKPMNLKQKFDLAISMEVAEHLPKESADSFVDSLTKLSDMVVFSAAIPHQGGNQHVNEEWQDYWAIKFAARNYVPIDYVRPKIWTNKKVKWWYAQNTILYVKKERLNKNRKLKTMYDISRDNPLSVIHPDNFHYSGTLFDKFKNYIYKKLIGV